MADLRRRSALVEAAIAMFPRLWQKAYTDWCHLAMLPPA
ncbi:hypothetical protein PPL19_20981, partial [Pseudomonas psychrotolerans L19]